MLSKLYIESNINKFFKESGMDSFDRCLDQAHFKSFPYQVDYYYNSRGFRDNEWPYKEDLVDCIWCFGDSYTVGFGSPLEHTWVNILQQKTNRRCINISMDGASNEWIVEKVKLVAKEINPKNIIVQWSYGHRGQNKDNSLSDTERRIKYAYVEVKEQITNFVNNLKQVSEYPIIHSIIPKAFPTDCADSWNKVKDDSWPTVTNIDDYPDWIKDEIKNTHDCYDEIEYYLSNKEYYDKLNNIIQEYSIIEIKQVDYARDGMHYDIKTSSNFVQEILKKI